MTDTTTLDTTVHTTCPWCGRRNAVRVNAADWQRWRDGALIQSAMPYLDQDHREQLMTGIHQSCWDAMFADDEGDEVDRDRDYP